MEREIKGYYNGPGERWGGLDHSRSGEEGTE